MRLKAAIRLLFFLLAVTTAFSIQQSTSGQHSNNGDYIRSSKLLGVVYSAAQSNQAEPPSSPGTLEEHFEARRQNFKSGRELLLDKGVTFEPEELLRDQRSKTLKDALDAMPEMHQSRYETSALKGAYFADTLYLPEKVQLSGHTIIVANYVVFEGKRPVIKGHYDLYFFPTRPVAVLGTTLAQALHKKSALLSVKLQGGPVLPSFALIQDIGDRGKHQITFDTSGPEPQALRPLPRKAPARLTTASWNGWATPIQNCTTGCDFTGITGTTGASGAPGVPGVNGISPPNAPNGNCTSPSTGSNNGVDGDNGLDGGTGSNGGNGGPGGQGGNATNINAVIADGDTNQYNFIANGGTGGVGGEAGSGGAGGNGGIGANGGNGVACLCQLGQGGNAGNGTRGGDGGNGGNGGPGGTGGNGASITVSLPFNSPGATSSNSGGLGGMGGGGGSGNVGGNGGASGTEGVGATGCGSTAAPGNGGFQPSPGHPGAPGTPGANGASGLPGPAPTITFRPAPVAGGGPIDPCLNGATAPLGSGPVGDFGTTGGTGGKNTPSCSPVIIDLTGEGFFLTDAAHGVIFDIANTGHPFQIAWTANANNAWLVLDRNQNGVINSGAEMFGNFTSQPSSPHPNGFAALAVYDDPANGGNGDGVIDARDKIFSSLRLWVDANHDGISQPEELHTLPDLGIFSISLDYSLSERTDQYGNVFRYKAHVNQGLQGPSDVGKTAYDVFLVTQ